MVLHFFYGTFLELLLGKTLQFILRKNFLSQVEKFWLNSIEEENWRYKSDFNSPRMFRQKEIFLTWVLDRISEKEQKLTTNFFKWVLDKENHPLLGKMKESYDLRIWWFYLDSNVGKSGPEEFLKYDQNKLKF